MPIPEFVVELRSLVGGQTRLWLPGVTAVIRRDEEILLVQRSDNHKWTPVTGIVDPGEEPAVCAVREALEETGVEIRVDRLAMTSVGDEVVYANGDRAIYLDLTFACTWVSGEAMSRTTSPSTCAGARWRTCRRWGHGWRSGSRRPCPTRWPRGSAARAACAG